MPDEITLIRVTALGFLVGIAGALPPSAGAAQETHTGRVELNAYAGGLGVDDDSPFVRIRGDTHLLLGGRLAVLVTERVSVGGSFGWFSGETRPLELFDPTPDPETANLDIDVYLYNGEVTYAVVARSQVRFFGGAGLGAATFSPDQGDGRTELLIPLLTGIVWHPGGRHSRYGLRADVRDNLIPFSDSRFDGMVFEGPATHNFEFSGGISIRL